MSQQSSAGLGSISVQQLAVWRQENQPYVLLDVREDNELAIVALPNALHIPMGDIPARRDELPRDLPLVVMCHHGMRSQRVMLFLRQAGWDNAINLAGGIDAWASQVDETVTRY